MIEPIAASQPKIAALCRTYGVRKLEVFGSAASGTFDPERSDIDLIVDFADESPGLARRYLAFAEELEALLGHRIDLLVDKPFENPYFRASVSKTRETIYAGPDSEAAA